MTTTVQDSPWPLIIEASPLWELQYTGIANVVYEIVRRFVESGRPHLHIEMFGRAVPPDIVAACLRDRSGGAFRRAMHELPAIEPLIGALARADVNGTIGLFLNTKQPVKRHSLEAMMFYDFSPLLIPECHTEDTVRHHTDKLAENIATCDRMYCISQSTARDLGWIFGVPPERVVVTPLGHGLDAEGLRKVHAQLGGRPIEPFLLMLGTIEPRKNLGLVLEWLKRHPDVLQKFRVVIAGRQGWGPSFPAQIEERGLQSLVQAKRIVFMDYVGETLKLALLSGASALIYPSLFEGFGLPVLEAMAAGTPALTSVSTSMPEAAGQFGYYFDPYSVDSLDAAFKQFEAESSSGRLAARVDGARRRAENFSYDHTYELIRADLDQLQD